DSGFGSLDAGAVSFRHSEFSLPFVSRMPNGEVQRARERRGWNGTHCAARAPLQRRVRPPSNGALYASALILCSAFYPIPASAPFTASLTFFYGSELSLPFASRRPNGVVHRRRARQSGVADGPASRL